MSSGSVAGASSSGLASSVICEEVFDDNYQPSTEEINEYAVKIGIDPTNEAHLLHLARDGLMQALPTDWKICYNDQVQAYYYYNRTSKVSQWDHPLDVEYKALVVKERIRIDHSEELDSGIRSNDESMTNKGSLFIPPILESVRNRRFEVTRVGNNQENATNQIGLKMNMVSEMGETQRTGRVMREVERNGFTLSGTGSMFLKSNSKPIEIDRKSSTSSIGQNDFIGMTGSPMVKGILRDSSLTDVGRRGSDARLCGSLSDNGMEKSVRFNLEKQDIIAADLDVSSDGEDVAKDGDEVDYDEQEAEGDEEVEEGEIAEDDEEAGWDFVEGEKKGVREVKISPAKFLSKDTVDGNQRKLTAVSMFEKQSDNLRMVRSLYAEDTDSESVINSVRSTSSLRKMFENTPSAESKSREELAFKVENEMLTFRDKLVKEQRMREQQLRLEMEQAIEEKRKELFKQKEDEVELLELESLKVRNKEEINRAIEAERHNFQNNVDAAIKKQRKNHDETMAEELNREEQNFLELLASKRRHLENNHQRQLAEVCYQLEEESKLHRERVKQQGAKELEALQLEMKEALDEKRKTLMEEHKHSVEVLQKNHAEMIQELDRDLKTEEDLLKKDHAINLVSLRDKLSHEIDMERQRMKDCGEDRLYEKIRCEKRLLEDKYRCLKEKYVRLKTDVKLSLERRNRRREQQSLTTGSETERSHSMKHQSIGNSENRSASLSIDHGKPPTAVGGTPKKFHLRDKSLEKNVAHSIAGVGDLKEKKFGVAGKYIKHIQAHHYDDTTSISQSDTTISNNYGRGRFMQVLGDNGNSDSETFRRIQENNNNFKESTGRQRKKLFTRMKSASTSRLNSSTLKCEVARPCTPVENLRRQLQKLEDLEDQFPDNTLDTTYHLRYPFSDVINDRTGGAGSSTELEFFKHRIHLERDSVRRAKESLKTQRINFRARQREIKQRHKSTTRHTIDQLIQEEKELTEMEVNLHRTRALLGEKVIRLRHLEQSLQRIYEKEKPFDMQPDDKLGIKDDAATLSDLSSHSSSGISSTDFASDANPAQLNRRKEVYQESTEIIQSLENLNAEIREIWEILSKQQSHGLPPPPSIPYQNLAWPIISDIGTMSSSTVAVSSANQAAVAAATANAGMTIGNGGVTSIQIGAAQTNVMHQPIPTLADRLETYRQLATGRTIGAATAVSTIVSQPPLAGSYTTSLVERTRDLRNWLRQAKTEHELLANGKQADL